MLVAEPEARDALRVPNLCRNAITWCAETCPLGHHEGRSRPETWQNQAFASWRAALETLEASTEQRDNRKQSKNVANSAVTSVTRQRHWPSQVPSERRILNCLCVALLREIGLSNS